MNTIKQEIELIQKQIESTTEALTRSHLFLRKIELLKIQEQQKKTNSTIKDILEQLKNDLKRDDRIK